jgi:hypothetical protein
MGGLPSGKRAVGPLMHAGAGAAKCAVDRLVPDPARPGDARCLEVQCRSWRVRLLSTRYIMPPLPPPPPPPPSPPLSCIFSGAYGACVRPGAPSTHPASANKTKSAATSLCRFIASSGPPDPARLTRVSDRLDQARVIVLDVADPRTDEPGDHLCRRVGWIIR